VAFLPVGRNRLRGVLRRSMLIWEAESYLFRGRFGAATSSGLSPRTGVCLLARSSTTMTTNGASR
jgi:hypothetical protein